MVIDGGSTTLQMCPHLAGLQLQVLTNSLPIISALLPQSGTRIVMPSGQIFREQDIILSMGGEDDGLPHFHAPTLFMGAAAIGPVGLMQADPILASIERRLAQRADRTIVLVDSSKFDDASGHVVCSLEDIDVIVTDEGVKPEHLALIKGANIQLVIAPLSEAPNLSTQIHRHAHNEIL